MGYRAKEHKELENEKSNFKVSFRFNNNNKKKMLQIIINLTDIYSLFNHILLFQMAFLRDAEAISKSLSMAVSEVFSHTSGMSPHHKFECFMT